MLATQAGRTPVFVRRQQAEQAGCSTDTARARLALALGSR
jgi:hypothetical protein